MALGNQAPFPTDEQLTSIVLAYRNSTLIGELAAPVTPLPSSEYRYLEYDLFESFTVPNAIVGRSSRPSQVDAGGTERSGFTKDYGLESYVPRRDLDRMSGQYRPLEHKTEYLAQLMALDHERRVAELLFDPAIYPTDNKEVLSGTAQFSDFTNSDPLAKLLGVMDGLVMRPNRSSWARGFGPCCAVILSWSARSMAMMARMDWFLRTFWRSCWRSMRSWLDRGGSIWDARANPPICSAFGGIICCCVTVIA